jgi:tRNA nucleotidyltransferase (CCA-adding enzyme)
MVAPLLTRLRFSNEERERIAALVRHHLVCYDESWSDAAVRRWLRRVGPELADDLYALAEADVLAKGKAEFSDLAPINQLKAHAARVVSQGAAFNVRDLAIDGRGLMQALGLAPGPAVGELLRALLDAVVEDPSLNEMGALVARARQLREREPRTS